MLAAWIRRAPRYGCGGDTVTVPGSMDPVRTLVDVMKSVETKPNPPSEHLLGSSLAAAPFGASRTGSPPRTHRDGSGAGLSSSGSHPSGFLRREPSKGGAASSWPPGDSLGNPLVGGSGESLAPSLRGSSQEPLRNGAREVLPSGVFQREAFVSGRTCPTSELSFGNRAEPNTGFSFGGLGSHLLELPFGAVPPGCAPVLPPRSSFPSCLPAEDSLGSPRRSLSGDHWRYADVVCSFGSPPQKQPAGDLDSVVFGRLQTRFESSTTSWWQHQETDYDRLLRRFRFCGSVDMKGAGRVSADARRATVRCLQQVFGPAAGCVPVRQPPSA
jgi:hypothetical protein